MISSYLIENRHVAVKRCKRGLFMYNRNDYMIGKALDQYGEWCDFEIDGVIRHFLKRGDIAIDVGANIGTHTIPMAEMVGVDGVVHAFEPQPRNFCMLCGNIALNAIENVFCYPLVVGSESGVVEIEALPHPDVVFNYGGIGTGPSKEPGAKRMAVQQTKIDDLNLSVCKLVKIDVEDGEVAVIHGARELIKRCEPYLYVEAGDMGGTQSIAEALDSIDYEAWWSIFPYYDSKNFFCNQFDMWPSHAWSANLVCAARAKKFTGMTERYLGKDDSWARCIERIVEKEPEGTTANLLFDREKAAYAFSRGAPSVRQGTMKMNKTGEANNG